MRTLRHLQLYPEKNSSIGKIFKERLLEKWQSVAYLTDVQVETLCFLVGEMRPQSHMYSGQVVRRETGDKFVILSNKYSQHDKVGQVVLYCDPKKPERQEVIDTKNEIEWTKKNSCQHLFTPLMDLDPADTERAARNSILMDPSLVA